MFDLSFTKKSFSEIEKEILSFWKKNNCFKKSLENRKDSPYFTFYDGPPFATGLPHYGHILAGAIKDVIPRYQTMKGKYVPRRFGWDCHGLPVEFEMEKILKLSGRKEIEKMGIKKFCESCRGIVLKYTAQWKEIVERMGRWVDFDSSYRTMDPSFMESILWVFKTLYDKELIFENYKSMHICPRCATTLSNFEVSQNYQDVQDLSVTAKFELLDEPNTFLLAWTTTPWTLPGNLLLAVGKNIEYCKIKVNEENYIVAKNLVEKFFEEKAEIIETFKGKELIGKKYEPVLSHGKKELKTSFLEDNNFDLLKIKGNEKAFLITWVTHNSRISERMVKFDIKKGKSLIFDNQTRQEIFNILQKKIKENNYQIPFLNVLNDHVHCLIICEEKKLTEIVGNLKGFSSFKIAKKLGFSQNKQGRQSKIWAQKFNESIIKNEKEMINAINYINNNHLKHELPPINKGLKSLIDSPKFGTRGLSPLFPEGNSLSQNPLYPEDNSLSQSTLSPDNFPYQSLYQIVPADFVSTDSGTGIVHIAPAYGEDDLKIGQKYNTPFVQHVNIDGSFKAKFTPKFLQNQSLAGRKNLNQANRKIIEDLRSRNLLFEEKQYAHNYPHCWRCDSPLLNYSTSSFFVKVKTAFENRDLNPPVSENSLRDKILKTNQKINWIPEHLKDGRFGKWLENARDWAISRNRFWGTPIPIWKCAHCQNIENAGSIEEIQKKAFKKGKILALRHGEGQHNVKGIISSKINDNVTLTKKGISQAIAVGKKLKKEKIDLIFCSPLHRTRQTLAEILKTLGQKIPQKFWQVKEIKINKYQIFFDERIKEIEAGKMDGQTIENWQAQFSSNPLKRFKENPHKGESSEDVQKRVEKLLREIEKKFVEKNVLLVTHGAVINRLFHFFYNYSHQRLMKSLCLPGELFEFSFQGRPQNDQGEIDLHRPYIDQIKLKCCKCENEMKRVEDVLDCWFESGSMPYAQINFPFNEIKNFNNCFEAKNKMEIKTCQKVRRNVFCQIKEKLDLDGQDFLKQTKHFFIKENNSIIATCRVREIENKIWKIERVSVLENFQHKGLGNKLITFVEKIAQENNIKQLKINAMLKAKHFWEKCGFLTFGKIFKEAEIDHIKMKKIVGANKIPSNFPADFIAEGLDQTRGWFYTLHVLAGGLFEGNYPAFKNVITNGIVLAEDGQKMSKSKKNYPSPSLIFDKYGADSMRFYMLSSPVVRAEDLRFAEKEVQEIIKSVFLPLKNSSKFFADLANIEIKKEQKFLDIFTKENFKPKNKLDLWILAKFRNCLKAVTVNMDQYKLDQAAKEIPEFLENLTNFYIRKSRRRFWKSKNDQDKIEAFQILYLILINICKILAPFAPFFTEKIFQSLSLLKNKKELISVHFENWPNAENFPKNEKLIEEFYLIRQIISLGYAIRSRKKIRVRQPLKKAQIVIPPKFAKKIITENEQLICEELNIGCIEILESSEEIATKIIKADARKIGPKFGRDVQKIINEAKQGNFKILKNGQIKVLDFILEKDEIEIQFLGKKGFDVESNEGIVLALDTIISKELKQEGIAREIIRTIQDMRREADFEISDRIEISITGADEIVEKFASKISSEVLAIKISKKIKNPDLEKILQTEELEIKLIIKKIKN